MQKKTVLIVDDEPQLRSILVELLESVEFQVASAANGVEALSWLSHSKADLILSDIRMPEMDGIELLKQVKMKCPDARVALLSAFADITAEQARQLGALDLISKPFRLETLLERIERWIGSQTPGKAS